ncbi:hypothetical protein ACFP7A_00905 [Sporolactobacillus kofuensis]|uniref:DNA polymerase III beta sliding clamp central domain-containing protein n=1 Tax=Sporolactobacillus kofuensis TaxID=269672 RepID=A0ABW1W9V2_9BACL|nr:hypothetical protein [Sporolactobacillus kofuensis]MCO7175538.1 hypothetical protein [Sporolactobacillus kofuensis]
MISYTTFIKHASKVTKAANEARPTLKGIFHRTDGVLIATDSHRLYRAEGLYNGIQERLINPETGELIEGTYPDTDRLIPTNPKTTFQIWHIGKISKITKILWEAARYPEDLDKSADNKKHVLLSFDSANGKIWLNTRGDRAIEASVQIGLSEEKIDLAVNAGYLFEAFDLFGDCGFDDLTVEYYGNMRPLVFKKDNLLALVLPVRAW